MNEEDVLKLIEKDEWMMGVLRVAERQSLQDWVIGAGFIRNKVWDYLHGFDRSVVDTADIDLVYFNQGGNDEDADNALSQKLGEETGVRWEVKNQAYMHRWKNLVPYKSTEDALSRWPETATAVGVKLEHEKLSLVAPHGIGDLVNLIVRPSPGYEGGAEGVKERARSKRWIEKWPRLQIEA